MFNVESKVTDEMVFNLLCCGFEGGVGYWCQIMGYENPDETEVEFAHIELPLLPKGAVLCQAQCEGSGGNDEDGYWLGEDGNRLPVLKLDRAAVQRGLEVMQQKYPRHWGNFVKEEEDAETGDVFIQCALLGEVVYG